jgi:hypothetical protein
MHLRWFRLGLRLGRGVIEESGWGDGGLYIHFNEGGCTYGRLCSFDEGLGIA